MRILRVDYKTLLYFTHFFNASLENCFVSLANSGHNGPYFEISYFKLVKYRLINRCKAKRTQISIL